MIVTWINLYWLVFSFFVIEIRENGIDFRKYYLEWACTCAWFWEEETLERLKKEGTTWGGWNQANSVWWLMKVGTAQLGFIFKRSSRATSRRRRIWCSGSRAGVVLSCLIPAIIQLSARLLLATEVTLNVDVGAARIFPKDLNFWHRFMQSCQWHYWFIIYVIRTTLTIDSVFAEFREFKI